jgi:transposase
MYIRKTKHKHADGSVWTQVQLVEGYRPGPGMNPKHRVVRNCGYLENQKNPDAFLAKLQREVDAARDQRQPIAVSLNPNKTVNGEDNRDMNYGPFLLEGIYRQLKFHEFFMKNRDSKAQYDLEAIFKYLLMMQVINPDSKRSEYMDIEHIYQADRSFEIHDIYRALNEIIKLKGPLEEHVNERLSELMDRDMSYVYLDVTNFYQERDYPVEGTLGQRGVSKEHRTEPIIQFGLLLDNNGMPFMSETFPGNTADSQTFKPILKTVHERKMADGRIICVADKGLNTRENIDYLCNNGDGYLFSQIVRGNKGKRYQKIILDEPDRFIANEDGTYKYCLFDETYPGKDADGKTILRKRKVLIYWDKADQDLTRRKRDAKVERAQKSLDSGMYTLTHGKDGYIGENTVDKETGEPVDTDQVPYIKTEKVAEDELLDGYFCLVTSELDYDEKRMREVYHNLWIIENSFRTMKSDEETRPIYVWLDDHIKAHLLICQLALLIFRLIQASMKENPISPERIQRVLQKCVLDIPANGVVHIHEVSGKIAFEEYIDREDHLAYKLKETGKDEVTMDFERIKKALGVDISYAYVRQEEFNKELKKAAVALHNS